jgi:hypothetical protein
VLPAGKGEEELKTSQPISASYDSYRSDSIYICAPASSKDGRSKVLIDEDTIPKLGVFATDQKLRNFKHNVKQHYEDSIMHQLKAKAGADATRNANEQAGKGGEKKGRRRKERGGREEGGGEGRRALCITR